MIIHQFVVFLCFVMSSMCVSVCVGCLDGVVVVVVVCKVWNWNTTDFLSSVFSFLCFRVLPCFIMREWFWVTFHYFFVMRRMIIIYVRQDLWHSVLKVSSSISCIYFHSISFKWYHASTIMSYHARQSSVESISFINHVNFNQWKFEVFQPKTLRVTLASRVSAIDGSGQTRDYADAPCRDKREEKKENNEKICITKNTYMYAFHTHDMRSCIFSQYFLYFS